MPAKIQPLRHCRQPHARPLFLRSSYMSLSTFTLTSFKPLHAYPFLNETLNRLLIMPPPSPPVIAPLCDAVVDALLHFSSESQTAVESREDFASEVQALRKFSDLIERVRRAKSPQTSLEEEHWHALHCLMVRCRSTLSSLRESLANTRESKEYELHYNEPWKISPTLVEERRPAASVSTLRAHINLYTQTLQMSLQAINL